DHALRRGLGVRPGGGSAGTIFEIGHCSRFAPPEPRPGADRELRQRLGHIVDRTERVQRTCRGKADFVDARGDRRFDIFTTSGPWIPLPIAPGRDHLGSLATTKAANIFIKFSVRQRLFVLQSEHLENKTASGNQRSIKISRISRAVIVNAGQSTANYGECCSSVAPAATPLRQPSRDRDRRASTSRSSCGKRRPGGRSAASK